MGRRSFVHRLRAAAHRVHHRSVRGQAGGDSGPGCILASHLAARRPGSFHCADRVSRHQAGRSERRAHAPLRPIPLSNLVSRGERCDPDTLLWAQERLKVPVIDHWWQTESGWPISANFAGLGMLPVKPGSATKPVPGYDVQILNEAGKEVGPNETGSIAIKLPLPPGCLPTLWKDDAGYQKAYLSRYPGYYLTGDAGFKDEDGYLSIMSRIDDIINVAGHRLSTG